MVLPLRSAGFSMPESSRTTNCMKPLPPNMATILIGTPFCRTTIGPSPTMPPSGALPAPTCFATSTPPRATAKETSRPACVKYPLPWASWIGPKAGRIGGAGKRYVIFSGVCADAGARSSPKPNALPPARSQRRDIFASRADISSSPVGVFSQTRRPCRRTVCHYTPWYRSAIRRHRQDAGTVVEFQAMSDVVRLEYRDVTMRFVAASGKALTAVERVSLAVRDGEVVSLIGPSGCGKSTLLNIGSGLYAPSEGEAFVDGERVEGPNAHVAFMLQKDLLLPWRTVLENVMFGVEIQRLALPERRRRAHALLENLHLAEFADHYPHQLSGGMRQRVALARTLAVDPSVLLLDEPFSAVDAQTRMVLQRELAQTLERAGKTALLITHDLLEAVTLSDRVLVMSRRPGRIIDEIRVELPQRDDPIARRQAPRVNEYVARLMDRLDISEAGQHPAGASA